MLDKESKAIEWLNGLGYHNISKSAIHSGVGVITVQPGGGFKHGLACADQCGGKVKVIQLKFVPCEEGSNYGAYEPEIVEYDYKDCYELEIPSLSL